MKKLSILTAITFFLAIANVSFAQDEMKAKTDGGTQSESTMYVTPESFQELASENIGSNVEIEGMVVHVCKHGGKKMFIIGEDPDIRIKITASDKVSYFDTELEGSTVQVKGIIEPIPVEETVAAAEKEEQEDADHANYYHRPQYSISCLSFNTVND